MGVRSRGQGCGCRRRGSSQHKRGGASSGGRPFLRDPSPIRASRDQDPSGRRELWPPSPSETLPGCDSPSEPIGRSRHTEKENRGFYSFLNCAFFPCRVPAVRHLAWFAVLHRSVTAELLPLEMASIVH